jgi:hypothetical protein
MVHSDFIHANKKYETIEQKLAALCEILCCCLVN